jgi:hypothetical protein
MPADMKLVLGGAAAAAGYWFFLRIPSGVPSTGAWNGYKNVGGGTRMTPKRGDLWTASDGTTVVAGFDGTNWVNNESAQAAQTAQMNATLALHPVAPVVVPVVGANTLAGIYGRLVTNAKAPAAGLTVDQWGYSLNPEVSGAAPDPLPIFVAAIPGFDRSQLVTAPQYWAVMGPALKTQLGLSGLGFFGGGY